MSSPFFSGSKKLRMLLIFLNLETLYSYCIFYQNTMHSHKNYHFLSFPFSCSISWSLICKLKSSPFSLAFSFSKSSRTNANVVGTAELLALRESTVFSLQLFETSSCPVCTEKSQILSFWLLLTSKFRGIFFLGDVLWVRGFLLLPNTSPISDDFPLLECRVPPGALYIFVRFRANFFIWPQNHLYHFTF